MPFDYTKYDYDALVQEITRLVSEQGEWKDAYQSSTGQVLIQLIAAMTDQLHYMLERRTQENFLPTAKLQTSVYSIINLLGYRPDLNVASSGTLKLTLVDAAGNPIQNTDTIRIPKYSKINYNGSTFVNTDDIVLLTTTEIPYDINIIEGEVQSFTVDSSDTTTTLYNDNYINIPDYKNIVKGSFYITTPTQTFRDVRQRVGNLPPVDAIGFAEADDPVFDVVITNEGLRILFGDGINGEKPTGIVTVKYVTTNNTDFEILTLDNDFVFDDYQTELVDDSGNTYLYGLKNITTITGAKPAEDIDLIKLYAPNYVRTSNRAVTKDDYIYWILKSGIGNIVDVQVYGEEEVGVTTINANNTYVVYLTNDGLPLSSSEVSDMDTYLDAYKMITTQIIYESAVVIPLQVNIKLKRDASLTASNSEVYDYINENLIDFFKFGKGSLGRTIYHSELVDYFHTLTINKAGIDYNVADYVNIALKALYKFSSPWFTTKDTDVQFSYGNDGDDYVLTINDIDYSYTAGVGDTVTNVITQMQKYLMFDYNVNSSITGTTLTVTRNTTELENRFRFSNKPFGSAWTHTGLSFVVLENVGVSPDGNYDLIEMNDGSNAESGNISQTVSVQQNSDYNVVSLYIEKDSVTTRFPAVQIDYTGGSSISSVVTINTQDGSTASTGSTPVITVDDIDGFWRLSVALRNNSTNNTLTFTFYPAYTGTLGGANDVIVTGSVRVFGFQLENRRSAEKYVDTIDRPIVLQYEDFAIENRVLNSEQLNSTVNWVPNGAISITPNVISDSEGYTTIDQVDYSGTGSSGLYQQLFVKGGESYTVSWEAQQGTLTTNNYGVYDLVNSNWIVDPATNSHDLDNSLSRFTTTFQVPDNCDQIALYITYDPVGVTGNFYIGKVHFRKIDSSSTYVQTDKKPVYFFDQGYEITNAKSTTPANINIVTVIDVPVKLLNNPETEDMLLPNNVEIIREDGTVIATDDGAGNIYGGTVDYKSGKVTISLMPEGDYYIRYLQNPEQNFEAASNQVFSYSLPKSTYTDTTELLSTIEIV